MCEMADLVAGRLRRLGAAPQLIATEGAPPVVYAELGDGPGTLLIYNHYDVQPPEPLELWETDPFEPTIRDGKLYARGVADNKGSMLARMQAVEAWLEIMGDLVETGMADDVTARDYRAILAWLGVSSR
ncbi:MAG: M20/M25/M40 family metallo-hydrolase, partial [Chloroflexi bacterium]